MKNRLHRMVDRILLYYLIIGILNFIFCTALMYFLFNACDFSDVVSSLINYALGSVIWYLGCKFILFRDQKATWELLLRFVVEVAACYLLSYLLAAPLLSKALLDSREVLQLMRSIGIEGREKLEGNCEMTIGVIVYAVLNYFGQRYFVFSSRFELHRRRGAGGKAE